MDLTGKLSYLICCVFGFPFVLLAQEYTLNGSVKDGEQNALSYVNIVLIQPSDSLVVSGTSSDNAGKFTINRIKAGNYVLKATFVGYRGVEKPIEVNDDINVGTILLEEVTESLEEVTVTSGKPLVERKNDRLVFNVENTSLSSQSTFEILRNTPGVLMINDQVTIKNLPAVIYINDKRVYLTGDELKSLLENYSASHIKAVEVITIPPARYDAESGAVLNIITSKSISVGYKGSVNGRWTEAIFPKYSFGTDHYYKNNFLDLFAGYSYSPRKEYKHDDDYVNFFDANNNPESRWETDFQKVTHSYAHNLHTILDFTVNERNSLSVTANILHSPGKTLDNKVATDIFDLSHNLELYFLTDSELENDRSNLSFSLDYTYQLNDKGGTMNASSNYIYYDDRQFQILGTDYFDNEENLTNSNNFNFLAKQRNNIFAQQLDFSIPAEWSQIETGLKYSLISSNSRAAFEGSNLPDDVQDDHFKYDEDIYAAYVSLTKKWKSWSVVLGLRGEYTDVAANSIVLDDVNTQSYFELFPTVNFNRSFGEEHELGLNYKRSIGRPKYSSLNPYRYYLHEKQYNTGNPSLTRSIRNKIALDYIFKEKYIFSLYYLHNKNVMRGLIFQNNEERIIYNSQYNLDEEFQYSLDFTYYGYVRNWWYFYTYMSGYYMESSFPAVESGNSLQTMNTLGYYGQAYNQFTLSQDRTFTANLTLSYMSGFIFGSYKYKNEFSTDVGLTKKMWGGRAVATLNITDIFNTKNVWMISRYQNQDNGYIARPETRTVSFSLKYNFGNYRLDDNKRNTTPDEQERLGE